MEEVWSAVSQAAHAAAEAAAGARAAASEAAAAVTAVSAAIDAVGALSRTATIASKAFWNSIDAPGLCDSEKGRRRVRALAFASREGFAMGSLT